MKVALPLADLLRTLAVSAVLGSLAVAVWVTRPVHGSWTRLLDATAAASGVWAVGAAATCLLTFVSASALEPTDSQFGREFIG